MSRSRIKSKSAAPASVAESLAEISQSKYNPVNEDQVRLLNERINDFIKARDELFKNDSLILIAPAVMGFWWCVNWLSHTFQYATIGAATLYSYNAISRDKTSGVYHLALNHLYQNYLWLAEAGPEITADKKFLQLAELLAPYARTKEMFVWKDVKPDQLSAEFKAVLDKNNHVLRTTESHEPDRFWGLMAGAKKVQVVPGVKAELDEKKASEEEDKKSVYSFLNENIVEPLSKQLAKGSVACHYTLYGLKREAKKEDGQLSYYVDKAKRALGM